MSDFLNRDRLLGKLDQLLADYRNSFRLFVSEEQLDEVAMKRVVRKGKIVRKVKVKRKGFKIIRGKNGQVSFKRMTQQEKRARRKAAKKAWRVGKAARKTKAKRSLIKSRVRMKTLHGR